MGRQALAKTVQLMGPTEVEACIEKISSDVLKQTTNLHGFAVVGIHTYGVPLARRIRRHLMVREAIQPAMGILDINLYRDDLATVEGLPKVRSTNLPFPVDESRILLVDDVLYTGRTIRAALQSLVTLGRPEWIRLAVLVDRGQRQLPIMADYVGITHETMDSDRVLVRIKDYPSRKDEVLLEQCP